MLDIFPRNDNRLQLAFTIDIIIQIICPFLVGFLIGFIITIIVLSRSDKHTAYYKKRVLISFIFAIVLGIISFCVLNNFFSNFLYNLTSYVFTILGWKT